MSDITDLIAAFRAEMFDPELPGSTDDPSDPSSESLWTDDDIKRYISWAQNDFCRMTLCLPDNSTYKPTVTAGNNRIQASDRIIKVRRAYMQSDGRKLAVTTERDLEEGVLEDDYGIGNIKNWRADNSSGPPRILVTDEEQGYFRLYPTPAADDVCQLVVYRLPLEPAYDGGELEIPEEYRFKLIIGMKAYAYEKQDIEIHDEEKASRYKAAWMSYLRNEAAANFKHFRRGPRRVRYGGL